MEKSVRCTWTGIGCRRIFFILKMSHRKKRDGSVREERGKRWNRRRMIYTNGLKGMENDHAIRTHAIHPFSLIYSGDRFVFFCLSFFLSFIIVLCIAWSLSLSGSISVSQKFCDRTFFYLSNTASPTRVSNQVWIDSFSLFDHKIKCHPFSVHPFDLFAQAN